MPDHLPLKGTPDSLAGRLRSYIEPFEPSLVSRWRGADEALIGEYARLAGFGDPELLPPTYRSYVRMLGIDEGGLFTDFRYEMQLDRVVRLYRHRLGSELEPLSHDLPVCGMTDVGDQISFDRRSAEDRAVVYETEPAIAHASEPPIAYTTDGEWAGMISRSWEALVFQAAILRAEPRRLPYGHWLACSAEALEQAVRAMKSKQGFAQAMQEFAVQRGLTKVWASDSAHHIFLNSEASVYAITLPQAGMLLYAFAANEEFLLDIKRVLGPRFGESGGVTTIKDGRLSSAT